MTLIALPTPLAPALARIEKPTPSAHALPAAATVAPLHDASQQGATAGQQAFLATTKSYKDRTEPKPADDNAPEPFSALRFADPLPNLPELDIPIKAAAYQAALSVVRNDEGRD